MDYKIKIDEFEGPLDLLLHLIKESNIDIYDISIEQITKEYLDYINKMEELNINVASSYLVMASELLELKSKSLLPNNKIEEESDDYEENTKENLIKKLIEYKKYKEVSETFKELELNRKNIYVKSPESISNYVNEEHIINNSNVTIEDLLKAFNDFLARKELEKPLTTKVTNKEYSVRERIKSIKNILASKPKVEFTELFDEFNKSYVIVTFLSILEMCKEDSIVLNQSDNFGKILIELK